MVSRRRNRTVRSRDLKRRLILEAAADLILRRGMTSITVDDIAEHCRIAKGSIYYCFTSRDDLLAALLREGWSEFLAVVQSIPEDGDPTETFLDTLSALVAAYNRTPRFLAVLYPLSQVASSLPARFRASFEKPKAQAYEVIERRLRAAFPEKDHARLMREIGGLLLGILRFGGEPELVSPHSIREAVVRLLRD